MAEEVKEKPPESAGADPRFMTSLARGLDVLAAFQLHPSMTAAQAAKATGLSRSAASRCLFTLEQLGYVASSGASFMLCPAILALSGGFSAGNHLARNGQSVVDALRDRLGESCALAMFDTHTPYERVIYICRAETGRVISVPLVTGAVLPSYCASSGRVLLAGLGMAEQKQFLAQAPFPAKTARTLTGAEALREELQRVREQGWAVVDEELEAGLRSVAVPVRKADGETIAAISLATRSAHHTKEWLLQKILPELQAAAAHLTRVTAG